jgi:hypothetical protein
MQVTRGLPRACHTARRCRSQEIANLTRRWRLDQQRLPGAVQAAVGAAKIASGLAGVLVGGHVLYRSPPLQKLQIKRRLARRAWRAHASACVLAA